ncbi:MAG: hypothetical protein OXH65_03785, partial [Paracoccaceae bacterium]|nr:hypothetical protein [Paracoccaceae bacterium]
INRPLNEMGAGLMPNPALFFGGSIWSIKKPRNSLFQSFKHKSLFKKGWGKGKEQTFMKFEKPLAFSLSFG